MKKILIADDDVFMLQLTGAILTKAGYNVSTYTNPQIIQPFNLQQADLFILDLHLGKSSGMDFCKAMKAAPATAFVPVVMISADDEVELKAKKCGADAWLKKPVTSQKLIHLIERLTAQPVFRVAQ